MKSTYLIGVTIIIILIIIAAVYFLYLVPSQTVQKGDIVSVYYTGSFTNGTIFNSNVGQQPFNFTVGSNETIVGFDNAVLGMSLNENKTVTLPPSEAYGYENPSLIVSVPLSDFGNKTISVGSVITERSTTGQQNNGVVISVNKTYAKINFNSPLAGQTLVFTIRVVGIKS
ncbi:MAG: FKBP-type peptidyl-prolyl cis-trans isomerase [Candidatus Micrarchaeia archaeon]